MSLIEDIADVPFEPVVEILPEDVEFGTVDDGWTPTILLGMLKKYVGSVCAAIAAFAIMQILMAGWASSTRYSVHPEPFRMKNAMLHTKRKVK